MTSNFPFKGRISKVAFAAAILCSSQFWVHALPVGGMVSAGVAKITNNPLLTSIQQTSQNASINWQTFNLSAGESVHVIQPNASSVLLNRVLSSQPSQIFGSLNANGQIFLINPNGLLFGPSASVNTSGLVASTLNLSDSNLMAGRHQFSGTSLASVVNQGKLNSEGGYITLLGAQVDNLGSIQANGGRIQLTAQSSNTSIPSIVNNTGMLQAHALENQNGTISLIALGPNGTVNAGGNLDVSGLARGQSGGRVELLGQNVGLLTANIVASGDVAGGQVLIGGQSQSDKASESFTRATYVSASSSIHADAITQGDGGSVIVKATDVTRAHGQISVRGGALGGNGGFIETSADHLNVSGMRLDANAPRGKMGTWLIDPADVIISSAATTDEGLSANVYAPLTGVSVANINVGELVVALNAANIMITTENTSVSGAGQGDINVNAVLTWTAPTTLTLNATRDVLLNQAITGTNGSLTVNAGRDISVLAAITTTTGNLDFTAVQDVNLNAASTITTGHLNAVAGRNVNFTAASTITGGDMLLRADNDGSGPGVAGGTVNITCGQNCITLTNGVLGIRFNPASEASLPAELTAYASNLTGAAHTLDAKAWMFANGVNKAYDANTTANLVLAGGPSGASLVPGTANFTSKDVAAQRNINFSGYTTLDSDLNHLLWSPIGVAAGTGTTSASITAVPLTITAVDDQKTVDGIPYTGGNGVTYTSFVGGETQADLTGSLAYGGTSQGAVNVGSYLITPNGSTSQNYAITFVSAALNIEGTALIITPSNFSKTYGQTASLTGFTVLGLLNGDTVSSITQNSLGTAATASVASGPYAIVGSSATGSFVPGNYSISYVDGTLTVLPAPLTVTANNASKTFGQTASLPVTGFTSAGLVNGESITRVVNTSPGTLATATVSGSPYAIVPSAAEGSFVPTNYSISYVNGALSVIALPDIPPVIVPPVVEPPVVEPPVVEPPVVEPPVVVPPVVEPPVVLPPIVEPPVTDPPVVVPPVTEPPVVLPPVTETPIEASPSLEQPAVMLPFTVIPAIVRPGKLVFTTGVQTRPAELLSLTPFVTSDTVKSVQPIAPSVLVIKPVSPVITEEPLLPVKPVLIRPRKQDRN